MRLVQRPHARQGQTPPFRRAGERRKQLSAVVQRTESQEPERLRSQPRRSRPLPAPPPIALGGPWGAEDTCEHAPTSWNCAPTSNGRVPHRLWPVRLSTAAIRSGGYSSPPPARNPE